MSRQGLRPIAVTLSLLLLTAGPAQASPIRFADVVAQAVATGQSGRQTFDLSLRTLPQSGHTAPAANSQTQNPASGSTSTNDQTPITTPSGNTSVTNTEVQTPQGQAGNVEVIELGDVTGTVCDCGAIPVLPGHSFPKLPFLALAGIPLLFIPHGGDTPPEVVPTPIPPPPPPTTPTPEPATLLLLGSGLAAFGASARRRRAQQQARQLVAATNVGEV